MRRNAGAHTDRNSLRAVNQKIRHTDRKHLRLLFRLVVVGDKFNRLIRVTAIDGGITKYRYDSLDRLTGVTQPDGAVTSYEVDLNRQVTKLTQKIMSMTSGAT